MSTRAVVSQSSARSLEGEAPGVGLHVWRAYMGGFLKNKGPRIQTPIIVGSPYNKEPNKVQVPRISETPILGPQP